MPFDELDRSLFPDIFGPPPFYPGPKLSLLDREAICAAVHDCYIDRIRSRAAEYVAVLDPWVGEVPVRYANEPDTDEYREAYFRRVYERCGAGDEAEAELEMATHYLDWVLAVQFLTDEHEPLIRECVEAVRADLGGPPAEPKSPAHSDDFRSVNWYGTQYTFTSTQAACLKVLWENWERGTSEVGEQTILGDRRVDSPQSRLSHVFEKGKHSAWGRMIVPGSTKGTFRLAGQ